MSELFETPEVTEAAEGKRSIPGATLVKNYAIAMASEIMGKLPTADADFVEKVKETQTNTAAMDEFVKEQCGDRLVHEDVKEFSPEEIKKILKSNQSNRSRRKSMAMTQSNYVEMLTSAIAEWIVRESCDIKKSAGGFGAGRTAMTINEETVAQLAEDQEALGRAIRNIQSKKSTYKAKHADHDYEQDPEWQELLEQEAMLKAVRTTTPGGHRTKGLSLKKALQFIFDGVGEIDTLGKDESHAILTACKELSEGKYPDAYVDMVAAKAAAEAEATIEEADVYAE